MSAVWNYFRKTNDEFGNLIGICTLCSRSLKIPKSKTTTNLLAHLRTSHGEELGSYTRRKFEAAVSAMSTPDDPRTAVHRSLARLVIEGALPLETTTLKPFRDFCSAVNPSYHPPSLRVLRSMLDEERCRIELNNRAMLADMSSSITLILDFHSTVKSNVGLLLIGAQMLPRTSLERRNLILDCIPLDVHSYNGFTVSDAVANCLRRHDVNVIRIRNLVANDSQIVQEAALYLRTKFVPCAAHSIGLVAAEALNVHPSPISTVLEKIRHLVTEVQRNKSARMQLKSRLREMNMPAICPTTDNPNRWITTYNMICNVSMTLTAFTEVVRKLNLPALEPDEVQLLESLRAFLEPFYSLTKQVCARDATASVFLAVGRILSTTTEKRLFQSVPEIQQFGHRLLESTSKYFSPWLGDEFLQMAAFLDPRFAYLETVQSMKSWTDTMERFIAHYKDILHPPKPAEQQGPSSDVWSQQPQNRPTSVWEVLRENRDDSFQRDSPWSQGDELKAELQHYGGILRTSRPAFNTDPIHWWRAYMTEFPILADAAFTHLTTPATSVDSQQLLSLVSEPPINSEPGKIRKTEHLLLMLKAHLHKDVSRECKAWSDTELHSYGYCEAAGAADVDDYDIEEDPSWAMFKSDEERTVVDVVEPLLSFVEEDDLDNMKNRSNNV